MPVDPSISLQAKPVDPTNYISGFLDLGRKKVELDKAQATLGADISQRLAESARANTEAGVAARTADPRVSQQESAAGTAAAGMNDAQLQNMRNHAANVIQQSTMLLNDPDLSRAKNGSGGSRV